MEYVVRKLSLGSTPRLQELSHECGELYSKTLVFFWRTVRKKEIWLSPGALEKLFISNKLHAHTSDACVQAFCTALKSWRARRKQDPKAKPPHRRRWYFRIEYKKSAMKLKGGKLSLSNGRGNEPLVIDWPWALPRTLTVSWSGTQYEAIAVYVAPEAGAPKVTKVAGIDLGEIHIAVSHDGDRCYLLNGRLLRALRRYQNKLKAKLSALLANKKNGSKRFRRLVNSKQKQLAKLAHQIQDVLHKQTTRLVSTLHRGGVQTLVIGDVRNIRRDLDYGKVANQKLHQWAAGKTRFYLSYKAKRHGMKVELENEAYTTQECPSCDKRHKPSGREYRCGCGFAYHRDGVGSWNIREKYLAAKQVVGVMAPPVGLRFSPHAPCSSLPSEREAAGR